MFFLPDPDFKSVIKKLVGFMLAVAGTLVGAIVIGCLFFNLDLTQVVSWFWIVVATVFVLVFIYAVVIISKWANSSRRAFSGWLNSKIGLFWKLFLIIQFIVGLAVLAILGVAVAFNLYEGRPAFDLEPYFEPLLSFLK